MSAIRQFKLARKKAAAMQAEPDDFIVVDDYEIAENSGAQVRGKTGVIFDDFNVQHKCEWDPDHPECPERYTSVINRCKELDLFERCEVLTPNEFDLNKINAIHDPGHYERLNEFSLLNVTEREKEASQYDSVYFNKYTAEAAARSVSCVLTLVHSIISGDVQNGFAIARPPGHHAGKNEFNGYCFINNVAVAARDALNAGIKKILIVDFDVHHGQGIQDAFYTSKEVLYFSIHRYENGAFWPNLRRSDCDFTGAGDGYGFNINVPLNVTGLGDADYMSVVLNILLPVAYEYQPELIIVAAGYDAAIGCFEFHPELIVINAGYDSALGDDKGKMRVTPGFYGHIVSLLSPLARGKIAVCLEGGYFLPSLAEGAAMILRSLLGDSVATLGALQRPHDEVIKTINDLKYYLRPIWKCFQYTTLAKTQETHAPERLYVGIPDVAPFVTRRGYPEHEPGSVQINTELVARLKADYERIPSGQKICYAFEDVCFDHKPAKNVAVKDTPQRLQAAYEKFFDWRLNQRCEKVQVFDFKRAWLTAVHDETYVEAVLEGRIENTNDIFVCEKTADAVKACAASVVTVVDGVLRGEYNAGVAFIRPPGHHAEKDTAKGFCFVNNVAVAAKYALAEFNLQRILVIDFDVHHGNGTQHAFYESEKVLFLSVHRYDQGKYFPHSTEANYDCIGGGNGEGFNVNIPLNHVVMKDSDYMEIFHRIILPIAYNYNPELVLVSAGFDCGINDLVGGYKVTPEAFGHFIQTIRSLARGKVVVVPEGGYNPTTFATSLCMCIKALLGDPLPPLKPRGVSKEPLIESLENVVATHRKRWLQLDVDKKIAATASPQEMS